MTGMGGGDSGYDDPPTLATPPPPGPWSRPYQRRRNQILHDHRLKALRPDRHPQGQCGRERARDEHPPRVASLIALPVVPGQKQRDKQRRRILPTVQDAVGKDAAELTREPLAEPSVVAYRAYQLSHD